jgi:hypothetical protein
MLTNGQSFHDASLIAIDRSQDDLTLSFENVYVDGTLRFAELKLQEVTEILCEGERTEQLELMEDEGEILELSEESGTLSILVAWMNFKEDTEIVQAYQIACRSIVTTVGSISPDNPESI